LYEAALELGEGAKYLKHGFACGCKDAGIIDFEGRRHPQHSQHGTLTAGQLMTGMDAQLGLS
jgi:hypothetical protein